MDVPDRNWFARLRTGRLRETGRDPVVRSAGGLRIARRFRYCPDVRTPPDGLPGSLVRGSSSALAGDSARPEPGRALDGFRDRRGPRGARGSRCLPRPAGVLLVVLLVLLSALRCGPTPAPPPSILLVTFDTTRPDHLGCHGYPRPTSPHLDALAARGVRFANAWSHAPETGPSLATVLTSRRAAVTGVRGNAEALDDSLPTLATVAASRGYRTAAFVSTILLRARESGFARGFGTYDDEMTDPCFGHDRAQRIASRTVDRAVEWIGAAPGPWFCWVHLYDPHGPYTPPGPTRRLDATRALLPSSPLRSEWIPRYQRTGDSLDAADYVDRYDREIATADAEFARLVARGESASSGAGVLIVAHADHGEALGEDAYWFRHGSLLHDPVLRVPWIVAGPGVPRGRTVDGDVRLIDLAPTLLGLARLGSIPEAEGNDLTQVVTGSAAPPASVLFAEARRREIVRDATGIDVRWKVRMRSGATDVTVWPGSPDFAASPHRAAVATWLAEPPRAPRPALPPAKRDESTERAMEGLGYR